MDPTYEDMEFWDRLLHEPLSDEHLPAHRLIASDILVPTSSDDFSVNANQGVGLPEQWVSGLNFSTPDEAQDVLNANDFSISANQGLGTTEPGVRRLNFSTPEEAQYEPTEMEMTMPMSSHGDPFISDERRDQEVKEVRPVFVEQVRPLICSDFTTMVLKAHAFRLLWPHGKVVVVGFVSRTRGTVAGLLLGFGLVRCKIYY